MAPAKRKGLKSSKKQSAPHARSATAVDKHVGLRVRAARLAQEMSQEILADALGITFQQVQKYEKGANRISISRLVQIADALAKPIVWFLPSPDTEAEVGGEELEELAKVDTQALLSAFARIKRPAARKRVVALVKAIADGG